MSRVWYCINCGYEVDRGGRCHRCRELLVESELTELGDMLYMTGEYPQSPAAFEEAAKLGDHTAGNWFLRAIILDKLRQVKPAKEAYEQFLSLSQGKNSIQEFQARQRVRILQRELDKR